MCTSWARSSSLLSTSERSPRAANASDSSNGVLLRWGLSTLPDVGVQPFETAADSPLDSAKREAELYCDRAVCLPVEKGEPDHVALVDRQPFDCATHMLSVGSLCHFVAGVGAVVWASLPE